MKELVINLDRNKVANWYQGHTGIRTNTEDCKTVETIVRDYLVDQCGPDYGAIVQSLVLHAHRNVNQELRYWVLRLSGEGSDFMRVCRSISENFAS